MMTACNGRMTFVNQADMLVSIEYRRGEQYNASVLPALVLSTSPRISVMDKNVFPFVYVHANRQLLKHTTKALSITIEGEMHACTGSLKEK